MLSETDKRKPRRPSDLYGGLATVAESGLLISPTSEWNLKQRRVWPPTPCQAYCKNHFLQECLVYYSLEIETIEEYDKKKRTEKNKVSEKETESLPAAAATSSTAQKQPTRVQPRRRAKGSASASAPTGTRDYGPSSSSSRRRTYQEFGDDEYEKMERRQELCLDISWAEFHDKLEALIKRVSKKLSRKRKRSPHVSKTAAAKKKEGSPPDSADAEGAAPDDDADHCPFQGLIKVECRYCEHRPEVKGDGDGKDAADDPTRPPSLPPNRGAPVAPMHILQAADFGPDQTCTFGGLTFAVDVCGGAESMFVVLIEMRRFDLERKDGEALEHGGDELVFVSDMYPDSNKKAKTERKQGKCEDLSWIPEEEE
ncbi:uncharacterized protein PG986_012773 [Apiospora aurea]|uniref:Uncharacterized protein n=1 Tax=Apiospora aurea TaxID=335848 RepID=A0ABR1Q0Y5_9PEZI